MKIKRIEHVGVVVKDTEASRKLWEECFGIPLGGAEENDIRKLGLYYIGESMVELISGKDPNGRHQRMVGSVELHHDHCCARRAGAFIAGRWRDEHITEHGFELDCVGSGRGAVMVYSARFA